MKRYCHTVKYYETDRMGITHHSNYIRWMEEARIDYLEQIGWPYAKMEEMGVTSPVRRVECKYKHSTTFADIVYIDVSVAEFKGVVLRLNYRMEKADGSLVCEAYSEHCFLDAEGKILRVDQAYPALYAALNEDK